MKKLESLLAPPTSPKEPPPKNGWAAVEKKLKTALPDDYKRFIERYGSGQICGFIRIYNPFAESQYMDLVRAGEAARKALRTTQKKFPKDVPYPIFPEKGGLLPFGISDNGDTLYWRTRGEPNDWTIVVNESRGPEYDEFDGTASEFLLALLTKKHQCAVFPPDFLDGGIRFA